MGDAQSLRAEIKDAVGWLRQAAGDPRTAEARMVALPRGGAARLIRLADAWDELDGACSEGYLPNDWWDSSAYWEAAEAGEYERPVHTAHLPPMEGDDDGTDPSEPPHGSCRGDVPD